MGNWKCGRCGKVYTTEEMSQLNKVKAVEEDTNPWEQHGFLSVCECGYVFYRDKWHITDTLTVMTELGPVDITVSTVFLELEHPGGWYETMLFPKDKVESDYQERYYTQGEAELGHKTVLNKLRAGKFRVEPKEYSLILED